MDHEDDPGDEPAPRRRRLKAGNVGPDGDYLVGKGRPPKHGQFRAGDGRKRGRRPKGQKNFDTEFEEEARRIVILRENGKERRITKLRSAIVRVFDNAASKGQHQAINTIFQHAARITDRNAAPSQGLTQDEVAQIDAWYAQRFAEQCDGDPIDGPAQTEPAVTGGHDPDRDDE